MYRNAWIGCILLHFCIAWKYYDNRNFKDPHVGIHFSFYSSKITRSFDAYLGLIVDIYGDDTNSHPLFDCELWSEASGGVKKGRLFGWGSFVVRSREVISSFFSNLEWICRQLREYHSTKGRIERRTKRRTQNTV